ncbi:hypothetical protein E4T56_gene1994 [Termitomyces sp. T112]|nr:hypothetical protein E4T56_gene1994 [Termitomyces sp. T112]
MPRGKNGHEQQGKKMAVSPHEESKAKFWGIYRVRGVGIGPEVVLVIGQATPVPELEIPQTPLPWSAVEADERSRPIIEPRAFNPSLAYGAKY